MTRVITLFLVLVLSALGVLHLYWAVGPRRSVSAAVPEVAGGPAFLPSRLATVAVAFALFVAAALVALAGRLLADPLATPLTRLLTFALGTVFVARAIGDFRLVGFFKRPSLSRFARLDTRVYSPLCLLLGIAVFFVACHAV